MCGKQGLGVFTEDIRGSKHGELLFLVNKKSGV